VVALGAWAALFWMLILTHRSALYLSPRVAWTIPFGAVMLTAVTLGQLAAVRTQHPEPLRARPALVVGLIVLPAVVIAVLPPITLGSFAASRRSALDADVARQIADKVNTQPSAGSTPFHIDISLAWVGAALRSDEGFTALSTMVQRQGPDVDFTGVVTLPEGTTPPDGFVLARFVVSCCLADAVSVQVPVFGQPASGFVADEWVDVHGDLVFEGSAISIRAASVESVPTPAQPYLWASA
jgi:uncharacterized repeat protein (TIGR03943 family)